MSILLIDSVMNENNPHVKYLIKIENLGNYSVALFIDFLGVECYRNEDKSITACLVDKNGDELHLNLARSLRKIHIKPNETYITEEREVYFDSLCWQYYDLKNYQYYIAGEYFDPRYKNLFYSSKVSIKTLRK